jgi:hypothetical protein
LTDNQLVDIYKKAKYIAIFRDGTCRLKVGFPSQEIDKIIDRYETPIGALLQKEGYSKTNKGYFGLKQI